ncbi:MAG: flagellar hook-length control protein FliK [Cellvibrio sp.]
MLAPAQSVSSFTSVLDSGSVASQGSDTARESLGGSGDFRKVLKAAKNEDITAKSESAVKSSGTSTEVKKEAASAEVAGAPSYDELSNSASQDIQSESDVLIVEASLSIDQVDANLIQIGERGAVSGPEGALQGTFLNPIAAQATGSSSANIPTSTESNLSALASMQFENGALIDTEESSVTFLSNLRDSRHALTPVAASGAALLTSLPTMQTTGLGESVSPLALKTDLAAGLLSGTEGASLVEGEAFAQALSAVAGELSTTEGEAVTTALSANAIKGVETATAAQRPNMAALAFNQSFGQPGWDNEVGEKVLFMAAQNLKFAEIRLDPPELGSLQVRVSVQNDQAHVSFVSPHAAVREALDSQATRLREMLAEQGMNHVEVDVSDRRQQEKSSDEGEGETDVPEPDDVMVIAQSPVSSLNLVDHYV